MELSSKLHSSLGYARSAQVKNKVLVLAFAHRNKLMSLYLTVEKRFYSEFSIGI